MKYPNSLQDIFTVPSRRRFLEPPLKRRLNWFGRSVALAAARLFTAFLCALLILCRIALIACGSVLATAAGVIRGIKKLIQAPPASRAVLVKRSFFGNPLSLRGAQVGFLGRAVATLSMLAMISSQSASAATYYWDTTTTGPWSTAGNWWTTPGGTTSTVSPGSLDTAYFNGTGVNGNEIVQLSAPTSVGGLIFGNTGTTTIESSSATSNAFTIGAGGITINPGAGAVNIGVNVNPIPITLGAAQTWTNNSSATMTVGNNIADGGYLLTVSGSGNITIGTTVGAVLSGAGGLTVAGTGTLTLTGGSPNTYTGPTTINSGTLSLLFGSTETNGVIYNSSSLSALTLGSGILSLRGKGTAGLNQTQTFNGTTISAYSSATITPNSNGDTSLTLALGAITRNAGSLLNFSSVPNSTTTLVTTSNSNTNSILGTWVSAGVATALSYVDVNSSNQIVPYTGATAATAGTLANVTSATTNYSYSAAATVGAGSALTGNTLQYTGGTTTTVLGSSTLTLNGLMNSGSGVLTISGNAGTSGLIIGSNNELDIVDNTRGITISAVISGNGSVVYGGPGAGTLTLSGVDTYTGDTTVANAILTISGAGQLGSGSYAGNIENGGTFNFNSSAAQTLSGVISGVGALGMNASGNTLTLSGVNTYTGNTTITAGTLQLGDGTSGHDGTIANTSGVTDSGTLTFDRFGSVSSGYAINGSGKVVMMGTGTQTLSGISGYTGTTTVSGGTLIVSGQLAGTQAVSLGAGTFENDGAVNSAAALTQTAGTLQGTGNMGAISSSGGNVSPGLTVANASTATGSMTAAGNVTLGASTNFNIRLGVTALNGSDSDDLNVTNSGVVALNGANLVLTLGSNFANATLGQMYTIITGGVPADGGTIATEFTYNSALVTNGSTISDGPYVFTVTYDASGDADAQLTLTAVPEPGTWAMLLCGAGMLLVARRRRRAA